MAKQKLALGRTLGDINKGGGLGSLISTSKVVELDGSSSFSEIAIERISPNPNQPRTIFDEEALEELALSIKSIGIIEPIVVRKIDDSFQIIAGERRYRAAKKAGLMKIPAYVKTIDDDLVDKLALVENLQREDLNAIEIALSYRKLMDKGNMTQEQLGDLVGKRRATVTNYLRLLNLPAEIQLGVQEKKIDMAHARALLGLKDATEMIDLYNQILEKNLSVRAVETIVKKLLTPTKKTEKPTKSERILNIQDKLTTLLNSKVSVSANEKGKGKIMIPFKSEKELDTIISIINSVSE